jgi:DNA-binding beta-propeller fold protein YncE
MLDRRENVLLVYDRARRLTGLMRPSSRKDGRFVDVAEGADGGVFVLDGRARAVFEVRQGRITSTIPLDGVGIEKPVALAVDGIGDLFILDGRTDRVFVVNPDGERISVIQPSRAVRSRLGDPSAVAVDARGQVYLAGRKSGQVVRFR